MSLASARAQAIVRAPMHSRPSPALAFVAKAIATAGGAGYMPVAPGTAGTAVAVPLAWLMSDLGLPIYLAITVGITLLGIAAAHVADEAWGTHDSQRIVIDEVAGYLVTMAFVSRHSWIALSAGFVVFRVLDVVKPPPARWVDQKMPGGPGVVLDDVVAGLYGAGLMVLMMHFVRP
jgi:phosphatidylglycerophosphatase A